MAQPEGTVPNAAHLSTERSTELLSPHISRPKPNGRSSTIPSRRPSPSTMRSRQSGESRESREPDSISVGNTSKYRGKVRKAPVVRGGKVMGYVDEDYHKSNPWYGQEKTKPIFSLGKPLPRISRWAVVPEEVVAAAIQSSRSPEDLAELGEIRANADDEKDVRVTQSEGQGQRRTAAGVTHGDRHNDAGQPVFEYQPGEESSTRREQTNNTTDSRQTNRSNPTFAIDGEPIGAQQEANGRQESDKDMDEYRNCWGRVRAKYADPFAEFLATGVAIFLGLTATLSVNLSAKQDVKYGSYETACWAAGFGWMFGICNLAGGVSGAHMNPAISISLSIFRGFPWKSCLIFVTAQVAASIVAGALAYGIYRDTILHVDPDMSTTAKTFFSSPQEWVSPGSAVFDQIVGSAIMMIAVLGLGDDNNDPPGAGLHALVLGLLVTTLKFTLGYNIGAALNPASDLGPRIIAFAAGYRGDEVWHSGWWVYGPCVSTLVGSLVGCLVYDIFIFQGSESPVNYRFKGGYTKRIKKFFRFCLKEE